MATEGNNVINLELSSELEQSGILESFEFDTESNNVIEHLITNIIKKLWYALSITKTGIRLIIPLRSA